MTDPYSKTTQTLVVSYQGVRRAIGATGLLLPILLGPVGYWAFGIPLRENMSSYYHTALRDEFVGAMCAIGIFLFCYRGYDRIENWTANFGGISALGVALCPLDADSDPLHQRSALGYLHTVSGGVFFLTLAFYSLYHFPSRRGSRPEAAPHQAQRDFVYRTSGLVILASLAAMGGYLFLAPAGWKRRLNEYHFLFWGEWVAVWAFAAAWLTKGRAILADIAVDLLALPAQLLQKPGPGARGPSTPGEEADMADDPHDLDRFIQAQAGDYDRAIAEITAGRKRSHWMWYIFPQVAGLGSSSTAVRYAIRSADEARAYLAHPVLGPRLVRCAEAALAVEGKSATAIFGSPDDLKLKSSATLFASVSPEGSVFARLLDRFCDGERDERTMQILGDAPRSG